MVVVRVHAGRRRGQTVQPTPPRDNSTRLGIRVDRKGAPASDAAGEAHPMSSRGPPISVALHAKHCLTQRFENGSLRPLSPCSGYATVKRDPAACEIIFSFKPRVFRAFGLQNPISVCPVSNLTVQRAA